MHGAISVARAFATPKRSARTSRDALPYTEPDVESEVEEQPVPVGWGSILTLGLIALGAVALARARSSARVWMADPHNGGDGSFAVGQCAAGTAQPPWREASQTEIQQGLQSGALQ